MIEIYAVSYNAQPVAPDLKGVFAHDGGTIGRGPDNRLALPDPARHVSRVQAKVRWDGARFWIANVTDANPMFVNDHEVAPSKERTIAAGDELRLGLYVLRVRAASEAPMPYRPAAAATDPARQRASAPQALSTPPQVASIDALLGGSVPASHPFADLLGAPAAENVVIGGAASEPTLNERAGQRRKPNADPLAGASAGSPFADLLATPPKESAQPGALPSDKAFPSGTIPQDFDLFALPSQPSRNSDDPLRDLAAGGVDLKGMEPRDSDALINFTLQPDPIPKDALRGGTPSLVDSMQAIDPIQLFGGPDDRLVAGPLDSPAGLPMKDDTPELGAHFALPRGIPDPSLAGVAPPPSPSPADQPPPSPQPQPAAAPIVASATKPAPAAREARAVAPIQATTSHSLIDAFVDGAHAKGVHLPDGVTPELMRELGLLVYQAVAGAMGLIAARQITKREIGAEMTMIVSSGNNPLKFLPTPEAAMMQILGPSMPGFMKPADAMRNAFDDLSAHEIGVIAGTRAAFAEVLRRFDPAKLEERLGPPGGLESMLPAFRRAKLWSLYREQFNAIHREAQDDFDSLFGEAFIKAYQDEVTRHRRGL